MKKIILICLLLQSIFVFPDIKNWVAEETKARNLFNQGRVEDAIILFREISLSSDNEDITMESYYWLGLAFINTGKYKLAENNLEYYLRIYGKKSAHYVDAFYQRGVNFFLLEKYMESIDILDTFIKRYPENRMVSNSYYWLGECFYVLGRFDDAILYFTLVTEKYPATPKYEASVFKLRLIEHKKTELVLQNIIKWSNEQYLSSVNQFKINELSLLQALESLKSGKNIDPEIERKLRIENEHLRKKIIELEKGLPVTGNYSSLDTSERAKELELKAQLLDRKEQTLKLLEEQLRKRESGNE